MKVATKEQAQTRLVARIAEVSQEMEEIAKKFDGGLIDDESGDKTKFMELGTELQEHMAQAELEGLQVKAFELANQRAAQINFDVQGDEDDDAPKAMAVAEFVKSILGPRSEYKGIDHWKKNDMLTGAVDWGHKTAVTTTNAGDLVVPDYRPVIATQDRRFHVRDIFYMPGSTTSNLVIYPALTAETNSAAGVAEGGTKPESAFTWENQEEAVRKIADTIPVSEEMLADYGQMQTWLTNRLMYHIDYVEDVDLIWGSGAPTVTGILNTAGVQQLTALTSPAFEAADTYYDIIRKLRFLAAWGGTNENTPFPTDVMVSPLISMEMDLTKDGNQNYIFLVVNGGVWGLTLTESKVMTDPDDANDHYILVGSREAGQIWDREGLNTALGWVDDQFLTNMVTIRAEKRLAAGLIYPGSYAYYNAENIS